MSTHNVCFCLEIRKIVHVCGYPLLSVAKCLGLKAYRLKNKLLCKIFLLIF